MTLIDILFFGILVGCLIGFVSAIEVIRDSCADESVTPPVLQFDWWKKARAKALARLDKA